MKAGKKEFAVTATELLSRLPEIPFDASQIRDEEGWQKVELLHSVLAITSLNHESEAAMVKQVVRNALGKVPDLEE